MLPVHCLCQCGVQKVNARHMPNDARMAAGDLDLQDAYGASIHLLNVAQAAGKQASFVKQLMAEQRRHVLCVGAQAAGIKEARDYNRCFWLQRD